jgi:hypothetical protein
MFLVSKKLASLSDKLGSWRRYGNGLVEPLHVWFAHQRACAGVTTDNMHHIRVTLALPLNSSSFSKV